jgi:hypothetical protein
MNGDISRGMALVEIGRIDVLRGEGRVEGTGARGAPAALSRVALYFSTSVFFLLIRCLLHCVMRNIVIQCAAPSGRGLAVSGFVRNTNLPAHGASPTQEVLACYNFNDDGIEAFANEI